MKKIMVVDDEAIQRRVLGKMIREVLPDCEVIEASNGKAALELLKSNSIDVVITDIKMPIMDGFGFIEHVNETDAHTKIIILSGYRYFEYAQRAVQLGAFDYLLKPVKEESIEQLLNKVAETIRKEKMQSVEQETIKNQLHSSLTVYYEHLLQEWINNDISGPKLQELQTKFKLGKNGFSIVTRIFDTDPENSSESRLEEIRIAMPGMLENHIGLDGRAISFYSTEDKRSMITVLTAERYTDSEVDKKLATLKDFSRQLSEQYKCLFTIGVGGVRSNFLQSAQESYKEAQAAVDFRYFLSTERVIHYKDISNTIKPILYDFMKDEELLKEYIRTMKSELLINHADALFNRVIDNGFPHPDQWIKAVVHMVYHIAPVISDFVSDDVYQQTLAEIERMLTTARDYFDCKTKFVEILLHLMTIIKSNRTKKHEMVIEKCITYIDTHYMEDLSLETVSSQLFFSPNYLSMILKSHLGVTYTKYLTDVRLRKAVEMLENRDNKVYEIAAKVGFKDEKYFYRVFKNRFGVTPDEYRKSHH
ncbi:response regulator [Paenibacillus alkaliterrae]|uniref:response regulator n=1 Tax=Paenibacillus alkaliterrae TaxID=320909 RepID=UPI001F3464AE|nr:response regulator [Paenibacillus alkaliterrae]MCF2941349.1 response regulator [Paenibacillus alkaliterrae]